MGSKGNLMNNSEPDDTKPLGWYWFGRYKPFRKFFSAIMIKPQGIGISFLITPQLPLIVASAGNIEGQNLQPVQVK